MSKKTTWCASCGSKTWINGNCINTNASPRCPIADKLVCLHCKVGPYRSCNCPGNEAEKLSNALSIGSDLLTWLRNDYTELPPDNILGAQFENAFTEFQDMRFWFYFSDIIQNTSTTYEKLETLTNQTHMFRMANSDVWVLQNRELAEIMHAHLRVVLKKYL